jgi:hypothetical protein
MTTKRMMNTVDQVVLQVLLRALRVLYRHDRRVQEEIRGWCDGLTLKLVCGPGGAVLAMQKSERYGVRALPRARRTDITMRFKSVRGAFLVLTGQMSVSEAYAQHQFSLEGDIYQTMSFVRCVEYAESYLFPRFWSSRILKEVPEKQMSTLAVYALTLVEGV